MIFVYHPANSLIGGRSITLDALLALICSSGSISGNLGTCNHVDEQIETGKKTKRKK